MRISTKVEFGIIALLDIALNTNNENTVKVNAISKRNNISAKYLEQILPALTKNNLVEGIQGKGGGYRLTRKPEDYAIGEILRATEKDLAPVSCLAHDAEECNRRPQCKTIKFWEGLNEVINKYLDDATLADIM